MENLTIAERIRKVVENWFLGEPALFATFCTHRLVQNLGMQCAIRVGKGRIEYNPVLLTMLDNRGLEDTLKAEMIRILLKHPYGRQPRNCCGKARKLGSDCVLTDNYDLELDGLASWQDFDLHEHESYEWYSDHIMAELTQAEKQNRDGEDEMAELWEEDEMMQAELNKLIQKQQQWGSLPGKLVDKIVAETKAKVDYKKVLEGFRASILSSKRKLTRMRPNRRSGWQQMGSRYDFKTHLLAAVDVSGSVTNKNLEDIYSVINKAFRYGIEEIDVLQFDAIVQQAPVTLKKAAPEVNIQGRGGTNFQCVIDYVQEHGNPYDGIILLTDGCAPEPKLPAVFRSKLLWILTSENDYRCNAERLRKTGRVMMIE